ncbi:MAG: dipeptidase [Verrucomicrobia bacterium]|nr:dipeptidase [Verrucomicrobiota bacterium]
MDPLDDLFAFLRFPSISADPQFKNDVETCAGWLARRLTQAGLETQTIPTPGHPVVVARNQHRPGRTTVLIYGHYDVQPIDPLGLWEAPPFDPVVKGDKVYARGATDNKGQILAHILGVEKALQQNADLPVNLVFVIEGEEEVGSVHLDKVLRDHHEALRADIIAVSDTGMVAPGTPTFTYGLRGILCLELRLQGPDADLHSGIFGGSVANPATVLSRLIGALHDPQGRITISGFYDDVQSLEEWERKLWAQLPAFTDDQWLRTTGVTQLAGEEGFSTLERIWARPTAEVNGLASGYQGDGPKTIIPSRAVAKLSFRLVPNQDPIKIREQATDFFRKLCPGSVSLEILDQHQGRPYLVHPDSAYGQAAQKALKRTFQKPVAFIREGGSIPIIQTFKDVLGADTLLLGLALPDARVHSPNENFPLENFYAGIRLNQYLLEELASAA